MQTDALHSDL